MNYGTADFRHMNGNRRYIHAIKSRPILSKINSQFQTRFGQVLLIFLLTIS